MNRIPRVVNKYHGNYSIYSSVYVGRPSKWGNLFIPGRDGSRDEVCDKYEIWFETQLDLISALPELEGQDLICHCSPLRCHADYLLKRANPKLFNVCDRTPDKIIDPPPSNHKKNK